MFIWKANHKTGLITVQQKLAYETNFSYAFGDWINMLLKTHFDQSADSSHGV